MLRLAEDNAEVIHFGEITKAIVDTVSGAEKDPGVLNLTDLQIYKVKENPTVCAPFRENQGCDMGLLSSGAVIIGQILGPLNHFTSEFPNYRQTFTHTGDASLLIFADPERYMADSDFVLMPSQGLSTEDYFSQRAKLPNGSDTLI